MSYPVITPEPGESMSQFLARIRKDCKARPGSIVLSCDDPAERTLGFVISDDKTEENRVFYQFRIFDLQAMLKAESDEFVGKLLGELFATCDGRQRIAAALRYYPTGRSVEEVLNGR